MAEPRNGDGVDEEAPPSGELMRAAIADFASKDLEARIRILQELGILDVNGGMAPQYVGTAPDDVAISNALPPHHGDERR